MPQLTRSQSKARRHLLELGGRGLPLAELAGAVLETLLRTVPADVAGLAALDPSTLLYTRLLAATPGYEPNARHYASRVYLGDPAPVLTPPGMMRSGIPVLVVGERLDPALGVPATALAQVTPRAQAEAFRAIPGPEGGVLRAMFATDGCWIAGLEALRFDSGSPFDSHDVAFLRLVAPTVGQVIRSALDRERAWLMPGDAPPSGFLLLEADGRLRFQTPGAETWLRALRVAAGDSALLPAAVWSARAGLRAGAGSSAIVRARTPAGSLRIEATLGDEDGGVAIVLTPERPPPLPVAPAAWGLTERERRVVELLLCGASNLQLAEVLAVSENTVETHLRHIYEKAGVRGRHQVLARFFRETYRDALAGAPDPDA